MLRIKARYDPVGTVDYFCRDPALLGHERVGEWHGSACEILNLATNQPLVPEEFFATLNGFAPDGLPIVSRFNTGRRIAFDAALTADKTFSVAGLCLESSTRTIIADAWRSEIREVVSIIESLALYRDRRGDKRTQLQRPADGIAVAHFLHEASRQNDPHLHSHMLLLNAALSNDNQASVRWRALEPRLIFQCKSAIDHLFQHGLAKRVYMSGISVAYRNQGPFIPALSDIAKQFQKANAGIKAYTDQAAQNHPIHNRKSFENIANDQTRPSKRKRASNYFRSLIPDETKLELAEQMHTIEQPFDRTPSFGEIVDMIRNRVGERSLIAYKPDLMAAMVDILPQVPLAKSSDLVRATEEAQREPISYGWTPESETGWNHLRKSIISRRNQSLPSQRPLKSR